METQRNLIIITIIFISFIIYQTWQEEKLIDINNTQIDSKSTLDNINILRTEKLKNGNFITIKTDVLEIKVNKLGGNIEQALLLSYPNRLNSTEPFHLLDTLPNSFYQEKSGLIIKNNKINQIEEFCPEFYTSKDKYILGNDQDFISIPLYYKSNTGLKYTKTFILKRNDFSIDIIFEINNNSDDLLEFNFFGQFQQSMQFPINLEPKKNYFSSQSYRNIAYSADHEKYKKYSFKDLKKENINFNFTKGWIAILQQYFVSAWIPVNEDKYTLYTKNLEDKEFIAGFKSSSIILEPNNLKKIKAILFLGPKIQERMLNVAPNLDLTIDYGWLWFISQPLLSLLKFIYMYVKNWGFSIIIITFIVRGTMYPLTKAQYVSMIKIRSLQPKIELIRKRLNNKQQQSKEIIDLYKSEKINPLGSFLPIVIQMPIFLSLYYVLSDSIELRHAPFIFWINDLSSKDPYFVLPILMGITMIIIQKMSVSSVSSDPFQRKVAIFIPIIFTLFFLWFPSGLVLYYIVSNLVTVIQQKIISSGMKEINIKK